MNDSATHDRQTIWNRVAVLLCTAFGDIHDKPFEVHVDGQTVSIFIGDVGIEHDTEEDPVSWVYGLWHHTPGGYDTPPESDFEEVSRTKSLDDAVAQAAGLLASMAVLDFLEREAEGKHYAALEEYERNNKP